MLRRLWVSTIFRCFDCVVFCCLLLGATNAQAQRTMRLPAYFNRVIANGISGTAAGAAVAGIMQVTITISNISSTDSQSGLLKMLPGSRWGAAQVGRNNFPNHRLYLCASTTSFSIPTPGSPTLPADVPWSIPPGGSQVMTAGYFPSTFYSEDPAQVNSHSQIDAIFSPVLEIVVTQNTGAVIASVSPNLDGPVAGLTNCDGLGFSPYRSFDFSFDRTGVPLLINGGRPF